MFLPIVRTISAILNADAWFSLITCLRRTEVTVPDVLLIHLPAVMLVNVTPVKH